MNFLPYFLSGFLAIPISGLYAQDDSDVSGVTVKGRLVQSEIPDFEIDMESLNTTLNRRVELPPPPFPPNWPDMKHDERQLWIKEFEAGETGKAFAEERKKMLQAAPQFKLQLEHDGSFVVYDVPRGSYGLRGRLEKTVAEKNYVFEVFGQMEIGEDVDEVLLDPIAVTVTRLLKAGEVIPDFEVVTFDGNAEIEAKSLSGKNVLVSFWSMKSPPSLEFSKSIQKMFAAVQEPHGLQLLSICIDSDREEALEYVRTNRVLGWHGYAETWDHKMVSGFGVRSIPALFLIGTDGVIKMTNGDFQMAFRTQDLELEQIVINGLQSANAPILNAKESQPGTDGSN